MTLTLTEPHMPPITALAPALHTPVQMRGGLSGVAITEQERIAHLSFNLGEHRYAVNLLHIREVRAMPKLTRVAHAPDYVLGVTSLRGEIIPVLDLKTRFSLPENTGQSDAGLLIVSEMEQRKVAVKVDAVHDVISVAEQEIQSIPRTAMAIDIKYLHGMVQHDGQVILLIDLQKILSPDELHAVSPQTDRASSP